MTTALVSIFALAYAAIALEHPLKVNKSASALLAAGLLWGLVTTQWNVVVFFLLCVVVAALYGAWSVSRRIFYVQGVPAIAALAAIWLL